MTKNTLKAGILASAMAGCLLIGGISAYFTDTDSATNTFTVGRVEIDLEEPSWNPPEEITPKQEFPKDPQVTNTGINDAYIFLEVTVPYAEIVTVNDSGMRNEKKNTELFEYELKDGWKELEDRKIVDENTKTVRHLYAYCKDEMMTAVKKGETTTSLFDYIRFANIIEDEGLEGASLDVLVKAYGIQTKNLKDGNNRPNGNNEDGVITPEEVWAVLAPEATATVVE